VGAGTQGRGMTGSQAHGHSSRGREHHNHGR
jgi:hypothetical protein